MLVNKLQKWAGVGLLTLLGVTPLRAQAPAYLPTNPQPVASASEAKQSPPTSPEGTPVAMPIDAPGTARPACAACSEHSEGEQPYGLFVDAEYLLLDSLAERAKLAALLLMNLATAPDKEQGPPP